MIKRIIGFVMLLTGILGISLAIAGVYFGRQGIDQIGEGINASLALVSDSFTAVQDSFDLAKTAVDEASNSLTTVEFAVRDLSTTIADTSPLVDQISAVTSGAVPQSVEAIQESLYPTAELADQVDLTLRQLSAFELQQTFLGFELNFDLGITYEPEDSLKESLIGVADSLDGVSNELRALEPLFAENSSNLEMMGESIELIADDLAVINQVVIADINPILDQYVQVITQVETAVSQIQRNLDSYLQIGKQILTVLMIWMGVLHLAPLYVGWELLTGQRNKSKEE
jgi:archaellum component FlaC